MNGDVTRRFGSALLLVLVLGVIGCGGEGSRGEVETKRDSLAGYPTGPTREFVLPGVDNAVQEFGREATVAERQQASRVVEAWLLARVEGRWGKACSYMHRATAAYAVQVGANFGRDLDSCDKALPVLAENAETPRDNIEGGVASLRIKSGRGFAQYHGNDGRDWVVPVRREDGVWKIGDLDPIDRRK